MPTIWFSLFELKLQLCGILADERRKNALTSCLPNDVLLIIHDLLINQASYQCVKQRLLQWFEPNLSSRVTELLNYSSVTAEKPSQFLLMLRTKLAKSDMSQEMIRELFIAKMPENIQNCLIQRWSPRGRPWPRGHILKSLALALASKPQVLGLGLGLEALGPRKLPCPRLEDSTIFEQLKFC